MTHTLPIAKVLHGNDVNLLPQMGNRHGLITGATGTGKTVSLQKLAEQFSSIGVPVFMADVKGDLSGIANPGQLSEKMQKRIEMLEIAVPEWRGYPVTFWDVFGENGHPVRATISDLGPLLMSRLLNLNDTQAGVMQIVFKFSDDAGQLLLDLKDLRAMLQFVADNAASLKTSYGNVAPASVGAIQRGLLALEEQGGTQFFGEPMLNIEDFMQTDSHGLGMINILAAEKLLLAPRIYAVFLLWMLSELFENLPEVGDLEKPKMVFFFDEAHLLFDEAPKVLLDKIEQVVRLIRSKGVGVYFVSQNPIDIPDTVLGQLGNRIQHALRAFSPRDQKAVKVAAETMMANPKIDTETAITELGVGEALISLLDEKGRPTPVERAFVLPPTSQIGPITAAERQAIMKSSLVAGVYDQTVDRESAYEVLKARAAQEDQGAPSAKEVIAPPPAAAATTSIFGSIFGGDDAKETKKAPSRQSDTLFEATAKSVLRSVGTQLGKQIVRGVLGSIMGGRR